MAHFVWMQLREYVTTESTNWLHRLLQNVPPIGAPGNRAELKWVSTDWISMQSAFISVMCCPPNTPAFRTESVCMLCVCLEACVSVNCTGVFQRSSKILPDVQNVSVELLAFSKYRWPEKNGIVAVLSSSNYKSKGLKILFWLLH